MILNLARPIDHCPVSQLHGPGRRFVFWVQGCSLRCTSQCINSDALAPSLRYSTSVDEVIRSVLGRSLAQHAEGVTVLGGEPTDQPGALTAVLEQARSAGLSTMLYTGHVYENLVARSDAQIDRLLAACDIIVDGPFLPELADPTLPWRGSSNQRILRMSTRYALDELDPAQVVRGLDLVMTADGMTFVSGMHTAGVAKSVSNALVRSLGAPRQVHRHRGKRG